MEEQNREIKGLCWNDCTSCEVEEESKAASGETDNNIFQGNSLELVFFSPFPLSAC
jgi:hypothetical protein